MDLFFSGNVAPLEEAACVIIVFLTSSLCDRHRFLPMRALIISSICMLSLAWSEQALAKPKAESPEKAAKKACAAGDFRKGVEILADLYVQTDETALIYNQGRCYEQNHQWQSAIDRFREYMRKTSGLSDKVRAEAEAHIAECKRYLEEEEAKNVSSPNLSPPPVTTTAPTIAQPIKEETPLITTPASVVVDSGATLRTTGIVVGSVGLAALATAVILNLKANQLADSGNGSSQKSYKTGALICYSAGGAALAAGIVLYLIGHNRIETKPAGITLLPMLSPNGAALAFGGEF
jgi:hypothetical protein